MTKRLDILLLTALCLLLAVTAGSCAQNELDVPDGPEPGASGSMVTLKFKIHADNATPGTRSGLGQWEEESANNAERILNPNDIRVLILDSAGKLMKLVKPGKLSYFEGELEPTTGITGDGYYDLTVSFQDETIDEFFKDEFFKGNENAEYEFQVVIFANMNSIGGLYSTDSMLPGTPRENLQEIFTMKPDWFPTESNGIPMFGYKKNIKGTKAQLTGDGGLDVGVINMLRALSKIEVSDQLKKGSEASDGKRYPLVSGVEIIKWRDMGYLRTQYDYESNESSRLTTANISDRFKVIETPLPARFMNDNGTGTGVYRMYCPEALLSDITIRVYVQTGPGQEPKAYEKNIGDYVRDNNLTAQFGTDLVRNHIYRINVNSIGTQANITLNVREWGSKTEEYTLDDIVSMGADDYLQWLNVADNPTLFAISDKTYDGQLEKWLTLINGTSEIAHGKFNIQSPQGSTWRVYFIPGENGVDAFEFVDVDAEGNVIKDAQGNEITHTYIEGPAGTPANFYIRGKGLADPYHHTAKLVIEVRQPDGTVLNPPHDPANNHCTRYIIHRESKL